jgi:hypothetical protein
MKSTLSLRFLLKLVITIFLFISFFLPSVKLTSYDEDETIKLIYGYTNFFYYNGVLLLLFFKIFIYLKYKKLSKISVTLLIINLIASFLLVFLNPFLNATSSFELGYFCYLISILFLVFTSKKTLNKNEVK